MNMRGLQQIPVATSHVLGYESIPLPQETGLHGRATKLCLGYGCFLK